jgi:hypothetical protein
MKQLHEVLPWEALSKKAYWDRNVPLASWKKGIAQAHRSYLPGAIKALDPVEFIHYYGPSAFKADWPRLRRSLGADMTRRHAAVYDLAWSRLTSGTWNLAPDERITSMPKRRREFLFAVSRMPGSSIYALAACLGMQYRRAHDHARDLSQAGLVLIKPTVQGGRLSNLLFPRGLLTR